MGVGVPGMTAQEHEGAADSPLHKKAGVHVGACLVIVPADR